MKIETWLLDPAVWKPLVILIGAVSSGMVKRGLIGVGLNVGRSGAHKCGQEKGPCQGSDGKMGPEPQSLNYQVKLLWAWGREDAIPTLENLGAHRDTPIPTRSGLFWESNWSMSVLKAETWEGVLISGSPLLRSVIWCPFSGSYSSSATHKASYPSCSRMFTLEFGLTSTSLSLTS